jgi:CBS domain-containing protein
MSNMAARRHQYLRSSSYYRTLMALRRDIRIRHIMTPRDDVYTPRSNLTARSALATMRKKDFDMAPILDSKGQVIGYVLRKDLEGVKLGSNRVLKYAKRLGLDRILSSSTPVLEHLQLWEEHSYYLVISSNKLAGVVTYADLNKAPVRLIFYTILSEIETKFRKLVRRKMPKDSWETLLSSSTRRRINSYYNSDKSQNIEVDKATYLTFGQLLSLFDHHSLYRTLGFRQLRKYQKERAELNDFRNYIMHSKPLVTRREKMHPTLRSKLDFLLQFMDRIPVKNA